MSFKDKYCKEIGLGHQGSGYETKVDRIARSKHKSGGQPRAEHYIGEGVVKKVKGAYSSAKDTVHKVKQGIETGKKIYKSGKELYGHAKKGFEEGKKLYEEHGKPIREKGEDVVKTVRQAIGKKKGGSASREQHNIGSLVGAAAKYAVPAAKLVGPSLVGWGVTKALDKMSKKRGKDFKGGQIKMSRTAADFKGAEKKSRGGRTTRAMGGVGKIRKGQYDY